LTAVAEENRALFDDHPWAASVSTLRPPLGPGLMAKYEHELSALEGLGLDDVAMDDALTYLLSFVQAAARATADAMAAQQDSTIDDKHGPPTRPCSRAYSTNGATLATRVGTAAGGAHDSAYDPDHAYRFGLNRVLDGLAALIDRNL
jgi:hypothetical protein